MVVAKPTTQDDLLRVRTHQWSRTEPVCLACGLESTGLLSLQPRCSNRYFRCVGRHCAQHAPVEGLVFSKDSWVS